MSQGQTTVEYVLVVLIIVLVLVIAAKDAEIQNGIEQGSNYIANTVDEAATAVE